MKCFDGFLKAIRAHRTGFIIFVKITILIMDNTQTQSQYLAPKCEVFEVELEDFMQQTSYHYMGGPDD